MAAFDNTSLAIANSWLDPQLEAYLGYSLFDDVRSAATPYDKRSRCFYHLPQQLRGSLCGAGEGGETAKVAADYTDKEIEKPRRDPAVAKEKALRKGREARSA